MSENRVAVGRDAGLLDQWQEEQVEAFFDEEARTKSEKLFAFLLRLVRRDVASATTLRNVRYLSIPKTKRNVGQGLPRAPAA